MSTVFYIARYEVVQVIGRGGMGIVYLGRDPILRRYVAVKVLSSHLASDPSVVARFINEARIAASFQHPNIVTVYEAGQDGERVFIVMEYVEGKDLAFLIRQKGKLHPDEGIGILKAIASALDYAHLRGVIHRDVKPSNVLVSEDGVVKLMDFGIARVTGGERHTKTGVLVGTPEYMAPELWEGKDADKFSDLYSLGVMAYELLTGEVPFRGDTPIAIGFKHVHGHVPKTGINEAVDEVLKIALAKEREKRFQNGMAMVKALEQALKEVPAGADRKVTPVMTDVDIYRPPERVEGKEAWEGERYQEHVLPSVEKAEGMDIVLKKGLR
ncbi:MAG: serine/threonine-protein kinase, partial [Candidatus Caldarchaeum sp.]